MSQLLNKEYLYIINYPVAEKGLCDMEMKALFDEIPSSKNFFSNICVDPTRSPFIKERLEIRYCKDTIDEIIDEIEKYQRISPISICILPDRIQDSKLNIEILRKNVEKAVGTDILFRKEE